MGQYGLFISILAVLFLLLFTMNAEFAIGLSQSLGDALHIGVALAWLLVLVIATLVFSIGVAMAATSLK